MAERVALLLADLEGGGAQRSMVDLACGFHARGLLVDVLVVRARGELREALPSEVRLVALEGTLARLRYLHRERPRALLATSHSSNVAASVAARLSPGTTRVVLRIDSQLTRAPELAGTLTQRRRERRARGVFGWADAWIAISEGVADDAARLTGIPRERIVAIPSPVLTSGFRERSTARIEHPWLAAGSAPVVM